jgi:two-component system cell cycle sensor histidine kinase/response regulator CckA
MKESSSKKKRDLIEENVGLRQRIADLEQSEAGRGKAEETLRQSEGIYKVITGKMTDVIWLTDMELRTVYVTPSIRTQLGFSQEERLRQTIDEQLTPDSLCLATEMMARELALEEKGLAAPDRKTTLELELYHKDGSTRWLENEISWIRDDKGNLTGLYGMSRDITGRRRAEEALGKSEELFSRLIAAIPDMVVRTDLNGEILFINEIGLELSGYRKEEVIGKNMLSFLVPEDHERAMLNTNHMIERKLGPVEYRMIMKEGRRLLFEVNGDVLRSKVGAPYGMVYVLRDITERKKAEEERERLQAQLTQDQKLKAIGTLAGGIAHDFNNLLMGVQGYISLIMMDMEPSHPDYEKFMRIEEQVQSGVDLTRQLLGFARGGKCEVKPANINAILTKTSSMFGRTRKEIFIHRKYEVEPCVAEVDRGQMEQVFINLYVNAWHAMPGGGELYIETDRVILSAEEAGSNAVEAGEYIKITVTDNGVGMDEQTRERIFDPFFTTRQMGRGTGLGLATVYGIIKGHGGMIHVESEPGRGTTFRIHLPASQREEETGRTDIRQIPGGTETVLLVDDEQTILDVSRELLESLGYRVYSAASGQEAVAVYMERHKQIDIVILDMVLPGMSGGETFDRLRRINTGVKVLLASGYSVDGQARQILARGCLGFIQKPFQLRDFARTIRDILD